MIRVSGLSKSYVSGPRQVRVLSGVSFDLEPGQTLTVAGKSGSGKTTLLCCLGGLEKPDAGQVVCFDTEVTALGQRALAGFMRQHLGFMFQAGNLISYLTVYENIAFPLHLNQYGAKDLDSRVRELLDLLGISELSRALPRALSGGQAQRVAFARAIAHRPSLLLADEPTASLDSATGKDLVRLMVRTARENGTIIIASTHDKDIIRLSDRTISLIDGRTRG